MRSKVYFTHPEFKAPKPQVHVVVEGQTAVADKGAAVAGKGAVVAGQQAAVAGDNAAVADKGAAVAVQTQQGLENVCEVLAQRLQSNVQSRSECLSAHPHQ